ncbi:MAG: triose-phosphate isomerase [Bacteroidetes bacterium]|nr:triose-phosphate isomerase [Bacteroidota bacterium]
MKRKKFVAGNWKMNLDLEGAKALATELNAHTGEFHCDVALFPSYVFLAEVQHTLKHSKIRLGAQNLSYSENGAYTGEVSASMLASIGMEYVLIGHSERREYLNEERDVLCLKLRLALKYGLKPIYCIGEPASVRNEGLHKEFVRDQMEDCLSDFTTEEISNITIAYEPIWAIGTGVTATTSQAQEMHEYIRQHLGDMYSEEIAQRMRILYGGSCKPDNAKELFLCPDVDGGLIGGASLKAADFLAIIEAAQ